MKTANDDRVAFFSHVSHEFRTPLSVIIGFTEDVRGRRSAELEIFRPNCTVVLWETTGERVFFVAVDCVD